MTKQISGKGGVFVYVRRGVSLKALRRKPFVMTNII